MIGEAENNAMSAAITVRSGDSVIPIGRGKLAVRRSTVTTVNNANSGMLNSGGPAGRVIDRSAHRDPIF